MKIKITDSLQYEVASAKKVDDTIVAVTESGEGIVIGGDLSTIEISGGEVRATAPRNIVAGECVTIDGVLYLATENIPNGEPVIAGQNATITNIEEQLRELKGE